MQVTIRYRQEMKLANSRATGKPDDRFENTTFSVGYDISYPYADPPDNQNDYPVWKESFDKFVAEKTEDTRLKTEQEIQGDYDKWIEDNKPGA